MLISVNLTIIFKNKKNKKNIFLFNKNNILHLK